MQASTCVLDIYCTSHTSERMSESGSKHGTGTKLIHIQLRVLRKERRNREKRETERTNTPTHPHTPTRTNTHTHERERALRAGAIRKGLFLNPPKRNHDGKYFGKWPQSSLQKFKVQISCTSGGIHPETSFCSICKLACSTTLFLSKQRVP